MKIQSLIIIAILCLTTNVFLQIQFTTHIITPGVGTTDNATYVLSFDVDSDGDMDIVSSSWLDNKIAWYENDGNQNFTQHIIYTNATGASWLAAEDMDGDDDIDVLSTSMVDDRIYWYENDGMGNFTTHVVDSIVNTTDWGKFSVFAYDVDGDDDMDVLSGSWDSPAIKWHKNDGNQNFTAHIVDNPGQRSHVIAKDVDGDGDADILSASQLSHTVAWYENDGDENFTTHIIPNSTISARVVVAIDLDKDEDMDVAVAPAGGKFEWFENDGNQNFTTHSISEGPSSFQSIYVVDVDNDGDLDVLIASFSGNLVGWLENDGNQNFTFHLIKASVFQADTIWGEDIDGDGDIDVLSAALGADQIAWYESDLISTVGISETSEIPSVFALAQNYPNPFNPSTTIRYDIPIAIPVRLEIFDLLGQRIKTLINETKQPGFYSVIWNGRNALGEPAPSGVYIYRLQAGDFQQSRKLLLLK